MSIPAAGEPGAAAPSGPGALGFPCRFPLKVVGRTGAEFERAVREIVQRHVADHGVEYASRASRSGAYLSITATFTATCREQLDALYRELNAHELVLMTL